MKLSAMITGAALLAALPVPAATDVPVPAPDRPVYTVEELVVVGVRPEATPAGVGAVAVTPDSLALSAAPTLEEVLRELPHLHVRTNSRGEAEISTRGSDSRQVAVLVDGVPLTLAWDARADASVIPSSAPQEMTFTRGLSSMLHGPNVLDGVLDLMPNAKVSVVGLSRNHETLQPEHYFERFVGHLDERTAIIVDPMLATAGSMIATVDLLKRRGCKDIRALVLVAAPEGVRALEAAHPEVRCWTAAIDSHLNEVGYIIPGLGDAGDKIFGTKDS